MTSQPPLGRVVIVPGARDLQFRNPWLQRLLVSLYHLVGSEPGYDDAFYHNLKDEIRTGGLALEVTIFDWSRGIGINRDIMPASRKLINEIGPNTSIFAFSTGALVAHKMLELHPELSLRKIVQVATPNLSRRLPFRGIKVVNIYSPADKFVRLGCLLLAPFNASVVLEGENITNIALPNLNHNSLASNALIQTGEYAGLSLFEVYLRYLS